MELSFRETLPSEVGELFSVRARTRENPISSEQLAESGITHEVIVLPEYEGRGIGSNLLAHVVEWLRSVGFNSLWLAASPDVASRAHGFYRSLGWRPNGKIDERGDEILVLHGAKLNNGALAGND